MSMLENRIVNVLKYALADLEGVLPVIDPDGDTHPGWQTIKDIKTLIKDLGVEV